MTAARPLARMHARSLARTHTQAMPALLLLPAVRYWLILAERLLRQWVATPALGRGPRFVQFLGESAAADPGLATAVKLAM